MPSESCVLRFSKMTEHAFAPEKGSVKAAGFDLKRWECFPDLKMTSRDLHIPIIPFPAPMTMSSLLEASRWYSRTSRLNCQKDAMDGLLLVPD